jgi:hypothetical protein
MGADLSVVRQNLPAVLRPPDEETPGPSLDNTNLTAERIGVEGRIDD